MARIANKRIPVSTEIWETLHGMRNPGQTYSELIDEMITDCQEARVERLAASAEYVPLEKGVLGK